MKQEAAGEQAQQLAVQEVAAGECAGGEGSQAESSWAACLHVQLHSAQPETEHLHTQATVLGGPRENHQLGGVGHTHTEPGERGGGGGGERGREVKRKRGGRKVV